MKNKWLQRIESVDYFGEISDWLDDIIASKNSTELGYALYIFSKFYYTQYQHEFLPLADEEDIIQECVVDLLDYLDTYNPLTAQADLYVIFFGIVTRTICNFSNGFQAFTSGADKLAKKIYDKLKKDGKIKD